MASKRMHYVDDRTPGFYDTLMSFEMPQVWMALYVIALITLTAFLLML